MLQDFQLIQNNRTVLVYLHSIRQTDCTVVLSWFHPCTWTDETRLLPCSNIPTQTFFLVDSNQANTLPDNATCLEVSVLLFCVVQEHKTPPHYGAPSNYLTSSGDSWLSLESLCLYMMCQLENFVTISPYSGSIINLFSRFLRKTVITLDTFYSTV